MKKKIVAVILLSLLLSACGDPNYKPEDSAPLPEKTVVDYVPDNPEAVKTVVYPVSQGG